MTMTIEKSLRDFEFWGGAAYNVQKLTSDELDKLEQFLEEMLDWNDKPWSVTQINDILWFQMKDVCEWLELNYDEVMARAQPLPISFPAFRCDTSNFHTCLFPENMLLYTCPKGTKKGERKMTTYMIQTVYVDVMGNMSTKGEFTADLSSALVAASIYVADPDCVTCYIYADCGDGEELFSRKVLCYEKQHDLYYLDVIHLKIPLDFYTFYKYNIINRKEKGKGPLQ